MAIMVHFIPITAADVIRQIVRICRPIPPHWSVDVVVQLIASLHHESYQPLILCSILLVPEVILRQLVSMSDRIAEAVEMSDVRLGEREEGAMPHIGTAERSDIQIVQVHAGTGAPVV